MSALRAAWPRWRDSPVRDPVIAVVTTALLVSGAYGEGHPGQLADQVQFRGPVPAPTPAALLLVAAACLALAWRRRWPVPVLAISALAVVAYTLGGYVNGAALIAPVIALYAVTSRVTVRRAIVISAVTLVLLAVPTALIDPFGPNRGFNVGGGFFLIPGMVAAVCFGGIAVSNRRAYIASIQVRAEQEASRRVEQERLRIARDLHDVVAHTMATINVQAGVAAHVLTERPEAAAAALQAIKGASKEGLQELRAVLNVLRQADEPDPTQPAPGVGRLRTLVADADLAGLATRLIVTGEPRPLPAAVDLAAYRIVQESLTNAIRHAGPATATVSLRYHEDELRVEVVDTGQGPAPAAGNGQASSRSGEAAATIPVGGHGLAGMRERAASVGGSVEAGRSPAGGFRVAARLPLTPAREDGR